MRSLRRTGVRILAVCAFASVQSAMAAAIACSCLCCDPAGEDAVCLHEHPGAVTAHHATSVAESLGHGHQHGASHDSSGSAADTSAVRCCCGKLTMALAFVHPGIVQPMASEVATWTVLEPVAVPGPVSVPAPLAVPPTPPPQS